MLRTWLSCWDSELGSFRVSEYREKDDSYSGLILISVANVKITWPGFSWELSGWLSLWEFLLPGGEDMSSWQKGKIQLHSIQQSYCLGKINVFRQKNASKLWDNVNKKVFSVILMQFSSNGNNASLLTSTCNLGGWMQTRIIRERCANICRNPSKMHVDFSMQPNLIYVTIPFLVRHW